MTFLIFLVMALIKGISSVTLKLSQKSYVKNINDSILFVAMTSFFQIIFIFILPPYYKYGFDIGKIAYPLIFSIFYVIMFVMTFVSLKEGPTSLTVIIQNFNMFVPIIAGIFLWHETAGYYQIAGMALFIISLFIFNSGMYGTGRADKKITLKWLLITLASTFLSGCAVTLSKQYAITSGSSPKEFLLIFNAVILIVCLIYFTVLRYTGVFKPIFYTKYVIYSIIVGLCMTAINIIYMIYVARFASAFFFPLMNTSSIISVTIMSGLFLKERISKKAYAGIGVCIIALILLSI
jgi:drug/metabolite transporter (DMT)-like permease